MGLINFNQLQKLGQSLMVPVSVLPGAGLVVALGRVLQINSHQIINGTETITNPIMNAIGSILFSSGLSIFEQLPVIFAIGVAIGFAGGAGVAGLSAAAAYFTLTNLLKVMTDVRGLTLAINTGVFGGIIAGLLAALMYKKYHETKLHPVFGFFSGKRLVPIMSMVTMVGVGLVLAYVWPPIQSAINTFGATVTTSSLGPAFYAAGKRLLIPVGLHHVYYPSFLYEFGEYIDAAGKIFKGDSARYYAGDPTAGLFMASEFPIMLFGLPAAALAMTLRALKNKKNAVAGVMLSAALTSIVTGITEPIEFAFIFVAPVLFVLHVILAFVSGILTHAFDIHLGYTFSASVIDLVVGYFNQKNVSMLLPVGLFIGALYFLGFYFLIPIFNFKTPGRDENEDKENGLENNKSLNSKSKLSDKAFYVLQALGGNENIVSLDACITRLRLNLKDTNIVQESKLKSLGAAGMMKAGGGSLQVIFGTESDMLKEEMKKIISAGSVYKPTHDIESTSTQKTNITNVVSAATITSSIVSIVSPLTGSVVPLEKIPDPTFSQGIMGPGLAINPIDGVVYAPFDGTIVNLFRTNHALGLESTDGIELLIHIGLDTVKLEGKGFKSFIKQGDQVKKGQKLIEFDRNFILSEGKPLITPLIITNGAQFKKLNITAKSDVKAFDELIQIEK